MCPLPNKKRHSSKSFHEIPAPGGPPFTQGRRRVTGCAHSRSASDAQREMASPQFHKERFSPSPVLAGEKRFLAPCGYHFEISGNVSLYVCDHYDYASLGGYPVFLAAVLTEILKFEFFKDTVSTLPEVV